MKITTSRKSTQRVLQAVFTGMLTCASAMPLLAQNDEEGIQLDVAEPRLIPVPETATHASREADPDLLLAAVQHPEQFIGKPMIFENGREIGQVLDIRRNLANLELYFVADATQFFNAEVVYAVPADDVTGVEDGKVVVVMNPGMHLPGKEYFPEDYTDASENFPEESLED